MCGSFLVYNTFNGYMYVYVVSLVVGFVIYLYSVPYFIWLSLKAYGYNMCIVYWHLNLCVLLNNLFPSN